MEQERYDELLADDNVIKIGTQGGVFFALSGEPFYTDFTFIHRGIGTAPNGKPNKRIGLSVFQSFNPNLPQKPSVKIINPDVLILVNADNVDFAMLFKYRINPDLETAHVVLVEEPHQGRAIITDVEKDGLQSALQ